MKFEFYVDFMTIIILILNRKEFVCSEINISLFFLRAATKIRILKELDLLRH